MNDEAIFFKTLAGDEAVRERTRLVQRNLRMVLILVDGFADVAELKRKVGDAEAVESALAELERLGLIESIDARMARNSAAVAAAVVPPAEAAPEEEELPLLSEVVEVVEAPEPAPVPARVEPEPPGPPELLEPPELPEPPEPDELSDEGPLTDGLTVFDGETAAKAWMVPGMGGAPEQPVAPAPVAPKRSPLAGLTGWWQSYRARRAQAKEEALYERAYGRSEPAVAAGAEGGEEPAAVAMPSAEPEPIKVGPVRRGGGRRITLVRALVLGLLAGLLILLAAIVFFPYGTYRPEFERNLAQALGEPVKIADVQVAFTPYPAITLEGVTVGDDAYATVDALRLLPEPVSLFGIHRYREVRVEGLRLKESGLPRIGRWLAPSALGEVRVARLVLKNFGLDLRVHALAGLDASLELDDKQGLTRVVFGDAESPLQVVAVPGPDGVALKLRATDWQSSFGPPLGFAHLEAEAQLTPGRLAIGRIDGRLYEGGLSGSGELSWAGEPTLSLTLDLVRLRADKLLAVFGAEPSMDGTVSSRLRASAVAPTFGALAGGLRLEGSFEAGQGNLRRVDLVEAMRGAGQGLAVTGGTTRFEDFTGNFAVDESAVRLSRLRLTSGLLHASGQVTVSRKNATINGSTVAEMRGSATTVRATLALSGKAADPVLKAGQ